MSFSLDNKRRREFVEKISIDMPLPYEAGIKVSEHIDNERNNNEKNEIIKNCDHYRGRDGDIGEYIILSYNQIGVNRGDPGFALLVNEKSGRFVWYKESTFF